MITLSAVLFVAAATAEIGGVYLVWRTVREGADLHLGLLGAAALATYGVLAAFQPDGNFGRVLAAYGGVFVVGSLLWGVGFDGFRPDRFDVVGAAICLTGAAIIIWGPRSAV